MKLSENKLVHHLQVATVCKEYNTAFVISASLHNCHKYNKCLCLCHQLLSLLVKEKIKWHFLLTSKALKT